MNIISEKAKIGKNVKIGNFVTIYDDVEIGDNSIIESYCEIGYSNGRENGPLKIGSGTMSPPCCKLERTCSRFAHVMTAVQPVSRCNSRSVTNDSS